MNRNWIQICPKLIMTIHHPETNFLHIFYEYFVSKEQRLYILQVLFVDKHKKKEKSIVKVPLFRPLWDPQKVVLIASWSY